MRPSQALAVAVILLCCCSTVIAFDKDERIRQFFGLYDKNHDGRITAVELGQEAFFKILDQNHDGVITKEELRQRLIEQERQNQLSPLASSTNKSVPPANAAPGAANINPGTNPPCPAPPSTPCDPAASIPANKRQRVEQRFAELDKNQDGKLSPDEWPDHISKFQLIDTNHDQAVTLPEIWHYMKQHQHKPRALRRLEQMDRNGDGQVTREEWQGRPHMFNYLDRDRDGVIKIQEVAEQLRQRQAWRGRQGRGRGWGQRRGRGMRPALDRMDRNGDGQISEDEWQGPAAIFKRLDRNHDGRIDQQERSQGLRRRGSHGNRQLGGFIKRMDQDGDGKISQQEWSQMFQQFDQNHDGFITQQELRKRSAQHRHWDGQLINRMDQNGDGRVGREEWTGPSEKFAHLDVDHDGFITNEDIKAARKARRRQWISKMDQNHDGQISRNEWKTRPELFDRLDQDKNGCLSPAEINQWLESGPGRKIRKMLRPGGRVVLPSVQKVMQQLDKNQDGQITADEWTLPKEHFDKFDQNHDGVISAAELQQAQAAMQGK